MLTNFFYADSAPPRSFLALEGAWVALLGTFFAWLLFPAEASLVSVFLAAIASTASAERLLAENAADIYDRAVPPSRANLRLAGSMLAAFAGCWVGFSVIGLLLPVDLVESLFGHQLEDVGRVSFESVRFGSLTALLQHNFWVMVFFFTLALPFRHGGVMLAVAWNASVWGATFGVLARRWSESGGPWLLDAYARVIGSCVVHMGLEAFAYTLAGFAGVFVSLALSRYEWGSEKVAEILGSVGRMLLLGAACVLVGAAWESQLAPRLVALAVGGP